MLFIQYLWAIYNVEKVETVYQRMFLIFILFLGGIVVGFAFWICIAYGSDTTELKMPAQYSVILLGGISGKNSDENFL